MDDLGRLGDVIVTTCFCFIDFLFSFLVFRHLTSSIWLMLCQWMQMMFFQVLIISFGALFFFHAVLDAITWHITSAFLILWMNEMFKNHNKLSVILILSNRCRWEMFSWWFVLLSQVTLYSLAACCSPLPCGVRSLCIGVEEGDLIYSKLCNHLGKSAGQALTAAKSQSFS